MRPVLLSDTVHTDSFTVHNNNHNHNHNSKRLLLARLKIRNALTVTKN